MIENFFNMLFAAIAELKVHLPITIGFMVILFSIQCLNWLLNYHLNCLGIRPRKLSGLIGIPCSAFLHGDFTHLMFNSFPLFMFSNFILLQGVPLFYMATITIILLSGLLIWIFGRPGIHVGASSLIMGYLGFIVIHIYYQPTILSVIVGVVCIYYFAGIFSNLLPARNKKISWEGHLLGFIAGIIAAPVYYFFE